MRMVLTILTVAMAAAPLHAQGWIEPPTGDRLAVAKLRTVVEVRVTDRVALVEVEEWFENRGPALEEGDYLYPLPGEAVFSNFSLYQGDRELRGETMDAARARQMYEDIVRRKKDPALIELMGHGLIRARVFPFGPGQTRKITLRYTQLLERAGDALRFQYAAGGRTRIVRPVEGGRRSSPQPDGAPLSFRIVVDRGTSFHDPFSPTHDVEVTRETGRLTVRPVTQLHGDFTLFLPFARDVVGLTLATHKPASEDGYFMLTLSPGTASAPALPRDLTAVIDVSGSMSGEKLTQARAALRQLVGTLTSRDRFRLIAFSSRVSSFRPGWTRAHDDHVRAAERWIDGLEANGGTDLGGALEAAFAAPGEEDRLPIILFVTDGLPSVGEQNPERLADLAEQSRGEVRVFAFGVGYDVNTYLLDRLSDAGRGATEYVRPAENVETAIGRLSTKIRHPVLADLALGDAPVMLSEVYPHHLPDLFAGEELVIFGRYRGTPQDRSGRMSIAGRRNGETERYSADVTFPRHATGSAYIPRLWASRKIGALSQALRRDGPNPELEEELRETALRYGLLSEYTSYFVREPMDVAMRGDRRSLADRLFAAQTAAEAPAAHGKAAVETARLFQAQRRVRNEQEADALAGEWLAGRQRDANARIVSGRMFVERDGVWTDTRHETGATVVGIRAFSPAYFDLLTSIPELAEPFVTFDRLLVAGKEVSIQVTADGLDRLSERRTRELVQAFRGH